MMHSHSITTEYNHTYLVLTVTSNLLLNSAKDSVGINFKLESIKSTLKSATKSFRDQTVDELNLKYAWPALRLALTVFEKTLDGVPIPGLKGSIGGFLELTKVAEVCAIAINGATLVGF
jgi:hypothetical protein